MKRITTFLLTLVCALALLQTSSGCSGGVDLPSLQNPDAEALTTCNDIECNPEENPNIDVDEESIDIYEKTICSIDTPKDSSEKPSLPDEVTRNDGVLTHVPTSLCGKYITPAIQPGTHEATLPFHNIVYCDNREIPLDNPHPSCSIASDITYTYVNVPTHDFGVCILKLDGQDISSPFFVYRNNGVELTRYEILHTCVERFSCELGTFRSTGIGLIEAATESDPTSDDITFTILRVVDNYIIEATDMGNLANAALVLEDANMPVDDDVLSYNNSLVGSVLDFIEENCVE